MGAELIPLLRCIITISHQFTPLQPFIEVSSCFLHGFCFRQVPRAHEGDVASAVSDDGEGQPGAVVKEGGR